MDGWAIAIAIATVHGHSQSFKKSVPVRVGHQVLALRRWMTAHQFFQQIFVKYGPSNSLTLKTFQYEVEPGGALLEVRVILSSLVSHTLQSCKKSVKRKQTKKKLPFGLQPIKKQRKVNRVKAKAKPKIKGGPSGSESSQPKGSLMKDILKAAEHQDHLVELEHGAGGADDDSDHNMSDSHSERITSPSSSATCVDGDSADSDSDFDKSEEEEMVKSKNQRDEEKETRKILKSHVKLQEEVVPCVSVNTGSAGTQCNPFIGVRDVGCQTSARLATCKGCSQKISKGCGRIQYAYSLSKFASWFHIKCFEGFLNAQNGDTGQATSFLKEWLTQQNEPDSDLCAEVKELMHALETKQLGRAWLSFLCTAPCWILGPVVLHFIPPSLSVCLLFMWFWYVVVWLEFPMTCLTLALVCSCGCMDLVNLYLAGLLKVSF